MISSSSLQASNNTFNHVAGNQFNFGDNAIVTVNNLPPPAAEYVPPKRVNDAPILSTYFAGRLRELDFLSQALRTQNVATEEDVPTRCVVYGMPGVGKTKLILRFAHIVFTELLYSHVFWMSGATPDKLIEGMTKILDIVGHPERTRPEQNAKLTAARLWLEDSQQIDSVRWLLVLDNVDRTTLEFLSEHLPRRNVKGSILFTTRAADIAGALVSVAGGHHSTLDLRVPDLVETTHLLFTNAGIDASTVTPTQKHQAEELIETLGSLPLAVVQAASYMKQTAMTLDQMLQISKSERKIEMVEWESDLATDQQRSVVATFDTLLDQLERDFPETYDILRILSFLDPEGIPLAMLTDGARMSSSRLNQPPPGNSHHESSVISKIAKWTRIHGPSRHRSRMNSMDPVKPTDPPPELTSLASLILSPTAFPKALHKLQSLSLVEPLSYDGQSSLRIHDLIHFLTQEHVKRRTTYQAWLDSAVSLVCGALRRVQQPYFPQWWSECEKLIPHIRSLSKVWTSVQQRVNFELVDADVRLALYFYGRGRYDDAERLCERSVENFRMEWGEKDNHTLEALSVLADGYDSQGRFADAERAYGHVLAVRKKSLGADHHDTLKTMDSLARIYYRQHRNKEAEQLYRRVLAMREKTLGPENPKTLWTMNNLALVYDSQQRYDEAEKLYKHVLSHQEKTFGPDHLDTLMTAHNLAHVYRSQTKYTDAEELYERTLVRCEKELGPIHPFTLIVVWHLAYLYQTQTRICEAERFYLRAFTGMKQNLGASHPYTVQCAEDFGSFYRSQGRNSEADALLEGAVKLE